MVLAVVALVSWGCATEETVVLETNLYATESEQLVWSALSETFLGSDAGKVIRGLVDKLTTDLASRGLI